MTAPAFRACATDAASSEGTWSVSSIAPPVDRMPAVAKASLRSSVDRQAFPASIVIACCVNFSGSMPGALDVGGDDGVESAVEHVVACEVFVKKFRREISRLRSASSCSVAGRREMSLIPIM